MISKGKQISEGEGETPQLPDRVQVMLRLRRDQRSVWVAQGLTLFEAVRMAGIPLGASCAGQGICGFCKLQVLRGGNALSPIEERERQLLLRIGAETDERVACIAKVRGEVEISTSYW